MTQTTGLGFVYPEDDDYDTGADVPRAVQEAVESINDFLVDPGELRTLFGAGETFGALVTLGYQNSWDDGSTAAQYRLDVTGRLYLSGAITAGALDLPVVTFPAGLRGSIAQRWVAPYRDNGDIAIVEFNGQDLIVTDAPADPAGESISLDGVNWRVTA